MGIENPVVVTPDVGGIKMARAYAKNLGADLAIVDKRRVSGSEIAIEHMIGDVEDMDVILVDDMISTAGTITDACRMALAHGARKAYIAATHGLFCGSALERIENSSVERIFVTDTVRPQADYPDRIQILTVAPLLAEAIHRIHTASSVSSLFID